MGGVHVEVNFGGEPCVILLAELGGDEAQEGGLFGEEGAARVMAFPFLIDALLEPRLGGGAIPKH